MTIFIMFDLQTTIPNIFGHFPFLPNLWFHLFLLILKIMLNVILAYLSKQFNLIREENITNFILFFHHLSFLIVFHVLMFINKMVMWNVSIDIQLKPCSLCMLLLLFLINTGTMHISQLFISLIDYLSQSSITKLLLYKFLITLFKKNIWLCMLTTSSTLQQA